MTVTNQETENRAKWERDSGIEGRLLARYRRRLLSELAPLGATRVLDAGCGEGLLTGWLAEQLPGAEVEGLEARDDAVAEFRAANPGLESTRATSTRCRLRTVRSTWCSRSRCSSTSRTRPPPPPRCAASRSAPS